MTDIELLARLIYGEARGESPLGKLAVAHVVLNRVGKRSWYGRTIREVILKPWQFSAFNDNWPGVDDSCLTVAELVLGEYTIDPTKGATHYWSRKILREPPPWASAMRETIRIDGHVFMVEE